MAEVMVVDTVAGIAVGAEVNVVVNLATVVVHMDNNLVVMEAAMAVVDMVVVGMVQDMAEVMVVDTVVVMVVVMVDMVVDEAEVVLAVDKDINHTNERRRSTVYRPQSDTRMLCELWKSGLLLKHWMYELVNINKAWMVQQIPCRDSGHLTKVKL